MENKLYLMEKTMRWFGPSDSVPLSALRQAGCSGVVTALHEIPVGDIWSKADILFRKQLIEKAGLRWSVVESLPVHEDIKRQDGKYKVYKENYKQSLRNLSACGIQVVTYNFMPVFDWVRTDPSFALPGGARTLRFERLAYIAFDLFQLQRPEAKMDYSRKEQLVAEKYFSSLTEDERIANNRNLLLGLPGSSEPLTAPLVLTALKAYQGIDAPRLRTHLLRFLTEVIPVAEEVNIRMAIHPDDPPFPVFGLPRIVSTQEDLTHIFTSIPSTANGLCFCAGSLGVRKENDLLRMIRDFGERIHFLHLRNTTRDDAGNFMEAEHLGGDTDMVEVIGAVVGLMKQRRMSLPMRPDHGFQLLDDLNKFTYPGYSAIGRLKGLAEIRGVEMGLTHTDNLPA